MPYFTLFKALENRALTGKPLTKKVEPLVLNSVREKACLANAKADAFPESLYYLEMATERQCPYSSYVLGCAYLGSRLRNPRKEPSSPEWYNLFNGYIHSYCNQHDRSELINLTVLEQHLKPDFEKAHHYFQMAANFGNPQALLWLSRLAFSNSALLYVSDLRFARLFAEMAIMRIPRELDILVRHFKLHEIAYLCDWEPLLASQLLSSEWFVQFLLEPEEPFDQNNRNILYHLLTVNQEVALKFLTDEEFLSHFNPYQITEMLHSVLGEFPELHHVLRQAFCYKKHKQ